jgi:glycosyltransferase involved in cell wall biosynthesis
MPKVSIIIINYNHEKYLRKRIASILAQTCKDYEIKIYDDCSTDGSRDIIESFRTDPKVVHIDYNKKNSGSPFTQWVKGITEATGEWLWIAESDDYADPEFLDCLVGLANENKNVGIAFSGSYWIDDKGEAGPDLSLYDEPFFRDGLAEIRQKLGKQCTIQNASSAIIRRDLALKNIEGISNYRACGDWIFYLRILQQANIVYTSKKLNYFRWYHNNVSNSAKTDGTWINEGINVLKEMDYKKIGFSLIEFSRLIKWWAVRIYTSQAKDKNKLYHIVLKTAYKYFNIAVLKRNDNSRIV